MLLPALIVLLIAAVALYLLSYLPIEATIKKVLQIVIVIIAVAVAVYMLCSGGTSLRW